MAAQHADVWPCILWTPGRKVHGHLAAWVIADNADPATPDRLIGAARERFGRLDGALISVGYLTGCGRVS